MKVCEMKRKSATDDLFEYAAWLSGRKPESLRGELDSQNWMAAERRSTWQHFIPDFLRSAWADLSPDARIVAYVFAWFGVERDGLTADAEIY